MLLLAAALLLAGCGQEAEGFRLEDAMAAGEVAAPGESGDGTLSLPDGAHLADVEIDDERRRAVVAPAVPWSWRGRVPRGATLSLAAGLPAAGGGGAGPLEVQVDLIRGSERRVLLVERTREAPGWLDLAADLSAYGGRRATLEVRPRVGDGASRPAGDDSRIAWSRAVLEGRPPPAAGGARRPNVLLIVVDTLRADHLTPYGYRRPTSTRIQELLADRGVVLESAFAQAPWTVPSAVSYLTGRYPGEILSGPMPGYAIPREVPSLGERMAAMGYATAAFYGNFILRDANGFGRGFATRYTPPVDLESHYLHADTVNRRAISWLRLHQHRPFFLYVHYMDPHDPYLAPDLVDGRSPFYPGYDGDLTGASVHPLYVGRKELAEPEEDLAHLAALYDSEVATVDRAVGELLAALDPEVAAETLFVFTSDHGEELYDHGGFKHGHTLYQEMIRVPLIFRWDGRLPPGERLAGTVQLVDLVPTIVAAAGGEADPAWQGRDLLPALSGAAPPAPAPAFAQHLASGPLRAAAVFGGRKLVLFDRAAPFAPADEHAAHHWRRDVERLERVELYDLAADPDERRNLATGDPGTDPGTGGTLAAWIHQRLDPALPGLKVMASGLPAGARLSGRIRFTRPPGAWHSYFLAADDRVSLDGQVLAFDWAGEGEAGALAEKGVLVEGELGAIRGIEARLAGEALSGSRILVGGGVPFRGGEVAPDDLLVDRRPRAPADGPGLRLWIRSGRPAAAEGVDPEVERSLRALGYIR